MVVVVQSHRPALLLTPTPSRRTRLRHPMVYPLTLATNPSTSPSTTTPATMSTTCMTPPAQYVWRTLSAMEMPSHHCRAIQALTQSPTSNNPTPPPSPTTTLRFSPSLSHHHKVTFGLLLQPSPSYSMKNQQPRNPPLEPPILPPRRPFSPCHHQLPPPWLLLLQQQPITYHHHHHH